MPFHLSQKAVEHALEHLCHYGDTDVFPPLFELSFFRERRDDIIREICSLDLDSFTPDGALEALAPKNMLSFRIAHLIPPIESLISLACVIEIGSLIEAYRHPPSEPVVFSYRFELGENGQIFSQGRTFRSWLETQRRIVLENTNITQIIFTDISDFYLRVNHHRLFDNLLPTCAPNNGAVRFLHNYMKKIRARQSFGLPVGGSAARLLAELSLSDTDKALIDSGVNFSRFVDDYRIFLTQSEDVFEILALLAESLGINEGLSLNSAKTRVLTRDSFLEYVDSSLTDVKDEATGEALDQLVSNMYFDEEPDEAKLAQLTSMNLVEMLKEAISDHEEIDFSKIRVIFRALKITKSPEAAIFITQNFRKFIIFAKDLCELMDALENNDRKCFDVLLDEILDAILRPPASSIQVIRSWLLEIFVRGIIAIPSSKIRRIESLPSIMDRRQVLLIRGRMNDINFFRRQKTAFHAASSVELPCLLWGASCLPKDEYETWLQGVRASTRRPTFDLYIGWLKSERTRLTGKLRISLQDHA